MYYLLMPFGLLFLAAAHLRWLSALPLLVIGLIAYTVWGASVSVIVVGAIVIGVIVGAFVVANVFSEMRW